MDVQICRHECISSITGGKFSYTTELTMKPEWYLVLGLNMVRISLMASM